MKVDKLLDSIGEIDETLLEESENFGKQSRIYKNKYMKALAACVCLLLLIGSLLPTLLPGLLPGGKSQNSMMSESGAIKDEEMLSEDAAASLAQSSFVYEGNTYVLQEDNDSIIDEKEIGEKVGEISDSTDPSLNGCEIYLYKGQDDKLLVKKNGEYLVYVKVKE